MSVTMQDYYKAFNTPSTLAQRVERFANTIVEKTKLNNSMDVLDFGCANGLVGLNLIKNTKKVSFLDPFQDAINQVQKGVDFLGYKNYALINKVIEEYDGDKFDVIFASVSLHHVEDFKAALCKMHSLLKPNGKLAIIDIYEGHHPDIPNLPHNGFDPKVLVEAVKEAGFLDTQWEDYGSFEHANTRIPIFFVSAHI